MQLDNPVGMKIGSVITIAPYESAWAKEFEKVQSELRSACGDSIIAINHVGSTSVKGLDAKPIIDILVAVKNLDQSLNLTKILESLGFNYRPDDELPDRHYFPRTINGLRYHHLSLAEPSSRHYLNTLTFRDALRDDTKLARQYGLLKKSLAGQAGKQRLNYLNGKTDFILEILRTRGYDTQGDYPTQFGATN